MIIILLPIKCTRYEIVISQKILDFVFLERFQSDSIESHFRSTLIFYSVVVSLNQIQFTKSKIKITSTKSKTTLLTRKITILSIHSLWMKSKTNYKWLAYTWNPRKNNPYPWIFRAITERISWRKNPKT